MSDDITRLQEAVAHQAKELAQLSDEVYTQQKEITILRQQVRILASRLRAAAGEGAIRSPEEETPPPHY